MKRSAQIFLLAGTIAGAANTGAAHAQAAAAAATTPSGAPALEEIIVTAQKREERLQDVPVAVTAVQAIQLEALGVDSAVDFRVAAPSLNSANANGFLANSIRGVGSFGYAPGIESPVGLYIDSVYVAAPQASELALNNIESVEVLKGPQGTLFGRNATGGLIHVITRSPSEKPEGEFSIGYGNYDNLTGTAYIGGGIGGDLAADLAFAGTTQGNGFGRNITTGSEIGKTEQDISLRSKWVWTPGSDTSITLIGNYWNGEDSRGIVVAYPGKLSGFVPGRVAPDLGYGSDQNLDYRRSGDTAGGSLRIDHNFGGVRFSSISAYREGTFDLIEDLDFTPEDLGALDAHQTDNQFSQEFQLSSLSDARFDWTVGLFYFQLKSAYSPIVVDLANVPGVGARITIDNHQTAESLAAYGQVSYDIIDNTTLTLGARYTSEKREEKDPFELIEIPAIGLAIPMDFPDRSDTASKPTYRLSLDHRFSPQVMGYLSVNTGFKSGGYNTDSPGEAPYKPETLTAYEAGFKTDLFDRRLRFDVAGFYYDYTNIQVQKISTFSLVVVNGPSARIYGLDGDFTALLSDSFNLTGGFNWIDPTFGNFPNCPVSTPQGGVPLINGSCSGNQIPFAATFTASLALNYSADLGGGKLQASANVYHNSGYFFESDNVLRQSSYAKLGATVKWTTAGGFSIGLFGKNLTDERTATFAATQASGNAVISYADPRMYGITLGYAF